MDGQTSDRPEKYSRAPKKTIYNSLSEENESKRWKMGGNPFMFFRDFQIKPWSWTKDFNQVGFSNTDKEHGEHCTESLII